MAPGTEVKVSRALHGEDDGVALLIVGVMAYSDDDRVVLTANEQAIGMPINLQWLTPTGRADVEAAKRYRQRYLDAFPGTLKE